MQNTQIQLPITFKCNFDCVMCGMRNLISQEDFSSEELSQIISDKLFQNVTGIGLNGGEPFLKKDLVECVEVITQTSQINYALTLNKTLKFSGKADKKASKSSFKALSVRENLSETVFKKVRISRFMAYNHEMSAISSVK